MEELGTTLDAFLGREFQLPLTVVLAGAIGLRLPLPIPGRFGPPALEPAGLVALTIGAVATAVALPIAVAAGAAIAAGVAHLAEAASVSRTGHPLVPHPSVIVGTLVVVWVTVPETSFVLAVTGSAVALTLASEFFVRRSWAPAIGSSGVLAVWAGVEGASGGPVPHTAVVVVLVLGLAAAVVMRLGLGPARRGATVAALATAAVLAGRHVPRAAGEAEARVGAIASLVVAAILAIGATRVTGRGRVTGGTGEESQTPW